VPTPLSLGVIVATLGVAVAASLRKEHNVAAAA
jgi:hypothetical protein